MNKGTDWRKLDFSKDDKVYEGMMADFHLFEGGDVEHEGNANEQETKQKKRFVSLKSRAQQLEDELRSMWKSKIELAYNMGFILIDLKAVLSGDFKRTVDERLPFSYSAANSYMNVATNFDTAEDAALFESKVMYAMATKYFPWKERQNFISRAKKGEIITLEEVREVRDAENSKKAAKKMEEEGEPIEFKKSQYKEMLERVRDSLEDIVLEVEGVPHPEELSIAENYNKHLVRDQIEKLIVAFEQEE